MWYMGPSFETLASQAPQDEVFSVWPHPEEPTAGRRLEGRPPRTRPMIRINDHISIDEGELQETFIRSSGPGGQNVNKLATAVQLRFDVRHSPSLSHEVRARLERLSGKRLTRDGVLVITAQRHRTQERNRADAVDRLV